MPRSNAVDSFLAELSRVIEYHRDEWELTYSEAIGCLEITKAHLMREIFEDDEDEFEDD